MKALGLQARALGLDKPMGQGLIDLARIEEDIARISARGSTPVLG